MEQLPKKKRNRKLIAGWNRMSELAMQQSQQSIRLYMDTVQTYHDDILKLDKMLEKREEKQIELLRELRNIIGNREKTKEKNSVLEN